MERSGQSPSRRDRPGVAADVLETVAAGGADDAGGLDPELLADFLPITVRAAAGGRRLNRTQIAAFNQVGKDAAAQGVALRALLDLYLSAAWRLWDHLPEVAGAAADPAGVVRAGRAVLRATDDVVAALTEGYQLARRDLIRAEASARREFVDDLLAGSRAGAALVERAAGFGLTLAGTHAVAVVQASTPFADEGPLNRGIERALAGSKADADALLATKDGRLVVVFAAPDRAAVGEVLDRLTNALPTRRSGDQSSWRLGVGRPHPGAAGVRESFTDALEALDLGRLLNQDQTVIDSADLLVYRVLLRDQSALKDLMDEVLTPLQQARGGADPLIDTLYGYFRSGGNTSATARALHLSVRAVSYRLSRVEQLTGYRIDDPEQRFTLHAAVLGARLVSWPTSRA